MGGSLILALTASAIVYAACAARAYKRVQGTQAGRLWLVTSLALVIGASLALSSSLPYAAKLALSLAMAAAIVRNHARLFRCAEDSRAWFAAYFISTLGIAATTIAALAK